ncbi:class I SAM-dependent methyltransferase [Methyloversatilis thermotolerans]|uniref:class I SAM-dependent methyltransferase n=1 Tax=Methyloversatilis thermotolerans TaxID=1346290 RepID=UPI00058FEF34|nr:methyltransferase domain-containing protein [Methyloversatilis thermotolerans]
MPSHSHFQPAPPSDWVVRFSGLLPRGARVLDYASGSGRHARWLAGHGAHVLAVDRDAQALATLHDVTGVDTLCVDLENGVWPWSAEGGERAGFDAVVVTRYLFRPRLGWLADLLRPGGMLIYETFMAGNERLGKPSSPDFLLHPDELYDWARGWGRVMAFEQGRVDRPSPAVVQRICAITAGDADAGRLPPSSAST